MAITVSTGHTLKRTVTGILRARKTCGADDYVVPLCLQWVGPDPDDYEWQVQADGHYSSAVHAELDVTIKSAIDDTLMTLGLKLIPSIAQIPDAPTPSNCDPDVPEDYEDDYGRGICLDYNARVDWELSGSVCGDTISPVLTGEVVGNIPYSSKYAECWGIADTWGYPPFDVESLPPFGYGVGPTYDPTEDVTYDESVPYSISISGTFKLMADYGGPVTTGIAYGKIEDEYPHDEDPYGMDSRTLEYYYVPTSAIAVVIEVGEVVRYSESFPLSNWGTQEEYEAALKNGFGTVDITATVAKSFTDPIIYPADERENMGEMITAVVGGMPNASATCRASYSKDFETYDEETPPNLLYTDGNASWTPAGTETTPDYDGGTLALTTGNNGLTQQLRLNALSADTVFNLLATDYDGAVRSGVDVDVNEFTGALSAWEWPINTKEPNVSLSSDVSGVDQTTAARPGDIRGFDAAITTQNRYYEIGTSGTGGRLHVASDTNNPPDFGVVNLDDLDEPNFPADTESEFHDGRAEMYVPASLAPGTYISNALTIGSPLSQKQIEFDTTSGWAVTPSEGAEFSIVDGKLQVVVGAADCSITKDYDTASLGGARFADLLYSTDATDPVTMEIEDGRTWSVPEADQEVDLATPATGATNPSDAQSVFGALDWGWGVREVGELTFDNLKAGKTYTFDAIQLKRKRPLEAIVFGGAFIGREQDDPRTSDDYTMWNGQTRKAIVIVDGMPAAEIKEVKHEVNIDAKWVHTCSLLDDADMFTPTGFLVPTVASTAEELETVFLSPGIYTASTPTGSLVIPSQVYGVTVNWPINAGNLILNIAKQFRGGLGVGLADLNGRIGEGTPVKIYSGPTSSGAWTLIDTINADRNGWIRSDALVQPLYGADKYYKIAVTDSSSNEVSVVVETRNRNLTVARLLASLPAIGLLYDQSTGILHWHTDGKLEYAE